MNTQDIRFTVSNLRATNTQQTMESIFVVISSLFVTALLPSLMVRYLYSDTQLFEQPKSIEYIPVAAFIISAFSIIYTVVGNMMRNAKIRQAETELQIMSSAYAEDLGTSPGELAKLEQIVDSALKTTASSVKRAGKSGAKKQKTTARRASK